MSLRDTGMHVEGYAIFFDPKGTQFAVAGWAHRVIVGRPWMHLPLRQQWAVLLHEAGHLARLHFLKRLLWVPLCWTKTAARVAQLQEMEADAFCAARGYGDDLLAFVLRYTSEGDTFYPPRAERVARLQQRIKEYSDANLP